MEKGFIGTIIGGVAIVAGAYLLINNSKNVGALTSGGVKSFSVVANSFQGNGLKNAGN